MKKQFDIVCEDILKNTEKPLIEEGLGQWVKNKVSNAKSFFGKGNSAAVEFVKRLKSVLENVYSFKSDDLNDDDGDGITWTREPDEKTKVEIKIGLGEITKEENDKIEVQEKIPFEIQIGKKLYRTKLSVNNSDSEIKSKLDAFFLNKGITDLQSKKPSANEPSVNLKEEHSILQGKKKTAAEQLTKFEDDDLINALKDRGYNISKDAEQQDTSDNTENKEGDDDDNTDSDDWHY